MADTKGLLQATFDQPLTVPEAVQQYIAQNYSLPEIAQFYGEQEAQNILDQEQQIQQERQDQALVNIKTLPETVGDAALNFGSGALGGAASALALVTSALEDPTNPRNSDVHNFFVDTAARINEAPLRHGSRSQLAAQRSYARRMEAVNRRTAREYQQDLAAGYTEGTATLARMGREAVEGGKAAWASGNYSQIVAQGLGSLATDIMLSRGMTGLSSVGKTAVKLAGGEEKLATLAKKAFDAAPPGIQKSAEWLRKNVPWMHSVAIQEGGGVYVDQYQKGLRMSFDELKAKSPEFNALVARLVQEYKEQGYSDENALASAQERARAILASKSAWDASIGVAGAAALTSLLTKGLQKPFTANPRGALATIAEALGEPLEESIQEGYGQYRQNLATQKYLDRTQDVMEGVGQSIAEGAIGGLGIVAPRTAIASAQLLGDAPGSAYDAAIKRKTKKETAKFAEDLQVFTDTWNKNTEEVRKTDSNLADKLDKNISTVHAAINDAISAYSIARSNFGLHKFDINSAPDVAEQVDSAYDRITTLKQNLANITNNPEQQKQLNALLNQHEENLKKAFETLKRSAQSTAKRAIREKGAKKLTPDDLSAIALYYGLSQDYSGFKDEVLNLVTPDKFKDARYKQFAASLQAQRLLAAQQARQAELQKEQEKAAQETTTATVDPTVLTEQPAPAPTPTPVQPQPQQQQTQPSQPVPQQQPRTPFDVRNYKKKNPHRFNPEGFLINDDDLSDEDLLDLANSGLDWIETFGDSPSDSRAPNALSASERRNFVKERIKANLAYADKTMRGRRRVQVENTLNNTNGNQPKHPRTRALFKRYLDLNNELNQKIASKKLDAKNPDYEKEDIKNIAKLIGDIRTHIYRIKHSKRNDAESPATVKLLEDLDRELTRHLEAFGYELPITPGAKYIEGMKIIARGVEDDSLPPGSRIIDTIDAPQINKYGKMVQVATVVVHQNSSTETTQETKAAEPEKTEQQSSPKIESQPSHNKGTPEQITAKSRVTLGIFGTPQGRRRTSNNPDAPDVIDADVPQEIAGKLPSLSKNSPVLIFQRDTTKGTQNSVISLVSPATERQVNRPGGYQGGYIAARDAFFSPTLENLKNLIKALGKLAGITRSFTNVSGKFTEIFTEKDVPNNIVNDALNSIKLEKNKESNTRRLEVPAGSILEVYCENATDFPKALQLILEVGYPYEYIVFTTSPVKQIDGSSFLSYSSASENKSGAPAKNSNLEVKLPPVPEDFDPLAQGAISDETTKPSAQTESSIRTKGDSLVKSRLDQIRSSGVELTLSQVLSVIQTVNKDLSEQDKCTWKAEDITAYIEGKMSHPEISVKAPEPSEAQVSEADMEEGKQLAERFCSAGSLEERQQVAEEAGKKHFIVKMEIDTETGEYYFPKASPKEQTEVKFAENLPSIFSRLFVPVKRMFYLWGSGTANPVGYLVQHLTSLKLLDKLLGGADSTATRGLKSKLLKKADLSGIRWLKEDELRSKGEDHLPDAHDPLIVQVLTALDPKGRLFQGLEQAMVQRLANGVKYAQFPKLIKNGKLDQKTKEIMQIIMVQWIASMTAGTSEATAEELAHLGLLLENDSDTVYLGGEVAPLAMAALVNMTKEFFGITENIENSNDRSAMEQETLIAEMANFMANIVEDAGFISRETAKVDARTVDDSEISTHELPIVTVRDDLKGIFKQDKFVLKHLCCSMQNREIYINEAPKAREHINIAHTPVAATEEQKLAVRAEETRAKKVNKAYLGLQLALGGLRGSFAVQKPLPIAGDRAFSNQEDFKSKEGQLLSRWLAFNYMASVFLELPKGMNIDDIELYFKATVWKNSRIGLVGSVNPQSNKPLRAFIHEKLGPVDLTDKNSQAYTDWFIALASNLGESTGKKDISTYRKNVENFIARVHEKINSDPVLKSVFRKAFMASEDKNLLKLAGVEDISGEAFTLTAEETQAYKDFLHELQYGDKEKKIPGFDYEMLGDQQQNALLEVVRYVSIQDANYPEIFKDQQLRKFDSNLSLEIDGNNDGPAHANKGWGLLIGAYTLAQGYMQAKTGYYEGTRTTTQANLTSVKDGGTDSIYGHGNQDSHKQVAEKGVVDKLREFFTHLKADNETAKKEGNRSSQTNYTRVLSSMEGLLTIMGHIRGYQNKAGSDTWIIPNSGNPNDIPKVIQDFLRTGSPNFHFSTSLTKALVTIINYGSRAHGSTLQVITAMEEKLQQAITTALGKMYDATGTLPEVYKSFLKDMREEEVVVFDTETTGEEGKPVDPMTVKLAQIHAQKYLRGKPVGQPFSVTIKLDKGSSELPKTIDGKVNPMIKYYESQEAAGKLVDEQKAIEDFYAYVGNAPVIGHNIKGFDAPLIKNRSKTRRGTDDRSFGFTRMYDTLEIARYVTNLQLDGYRLFDLARAIGIRKLDEAHLAQVDVENNYKVADTLVRMLDAKERELQNTPASNEHAEFNIEGLNYTDLRKALLQLFSVAYDPRKGSWLPITEKELGEYIEGLPVNILTQEELRTENIQYDKKKRMAYIESRNEYDSEGRLKRDYDLIQNFRITAKGKEVLARALAKHFGQAAQSAVHEAIGDQSMRAMTIPMQVMSIFTCIQRGVEATEYVRNKGYKDSTAFEKEDSHQRVNNFMAQLTFSDGVKVVASKNQYRMSDKPIVEDADKDRQDYSVYRSNVFAGDTRISGGALAVQGTGDAAMVLKLNRICNMLGINLDINQMFDGISIKPEYARVLGYLMNVADYYAQTQRRMDSILKNLGFLAKQLKHYGYAKEDASTEDAIIDCLIQLKNGKTFDGEDITDDYLDLKKALGLGEYGGIDGIIKRLVGMTEVNSTMNFDIFNKNSNFKGTRNSVDSELRADLKGIFAYYRSCWFNELVNNYAQKCLPGSMNHYSGISNCAFVYGNPVSVEEAKAVLDSLNTDNQFRDLTDLNAAYKNTIAMARLKAMKDDPAYAIDKPIIEHLIQERIQSKTKMLSDEQMRICQRDLRYSDTPIDDAYDNRKAIVDNIQAILGETSSQELKENAPSEESLREADKAAQQAEYEQRKQERELAKAARKEASKAEQEARKAEAQNWVLTKRQDASNPKAVYDVARDVFKRIADRYGNKRTLQRRLFDAIASIVLRLLPKNLDLVIVNDISRLPEHLRAQAAQNTEFSVIDVTSDGATIYILNQDKSIKDPFQALSAAANQDFLAHEFTHAALTLGIKQIIAKGPQGDPEGYKAVMSLVKLMQDTFLAPVSGVSVDSVDLPRVLQIIKEYWEDINLGTIAVDPEDPGSVERLALAVDETIAYVLTNKDAFNYLSQHIHLNASEEEVQNLRSVFRNLLSSVGKVIKSAFKITRKPLAKYFDAWLYRDPTKPPKTSMENDAEIFNDFFSMFSTATMAILRAVENNARTTDTSSAEPTQRFAKVGMAEMSVADGRGGISLYTALARASYPHKLPRGDYLDKTNKVISKVIKQHEQFVNNLEGLLRPCFMPDQARDIALATKALMFEDILNPSDRRDLANFYADIVEQIPSYEVFLEDKNAATPEEQEQALTLYNLVTGKDARYENSVKKDIPLLRKDFARPALLLALMLADPDIKESLSNLRQPKNKTESKAPAYSLRRLIEKTENSLLDRLLNQNIKNQSILGKLDSATKQQQELINNPPEDLAEKIDSMIFDWVNGAFRVGTIKFLEARGNHKAAELIREGSKELREDALNVYTTVMESFRHWTNKVVKDVNVVGWLSDVYGRVPTLQKFHERLKSINGFQDKNRKELLEDLPARLLNEFSRKLSRAERTFLDRILGATDITTLGRDEARQVFTDANKLSQAISKEEKHLVDMVGDDQAKHYQKKAKELAEYLMLGKISWNLLTNATAISRSFGEREYDPQHSTVVHSIDRLATMYAIDLLTPAEKEQAKQFYLNETKGMNTLFDQLYDIKDIETKRVEERHSIKAFKGWRPRGSIPSGQYIIVPARQQERYESEGFVLIGAYQADSLDNSEPMVRMWTKVPHPREFLEGLFQNINSTAFGFQINNRSRGEARGTHISAVNTLDRLYTKRGSNKNNKEQFVIPMYDLDGSVIGYERSVPQEDRKYLDENRDIFTGIAQYRSRQEREQFAIDNNIEVIKDCWDDFDQASSSEKKNEFIDVAHSADPVIRQAWEKIDIRVKEEAKKYFGDHFYIRKDLVYTVLGYERKSLVDIYDEKFLLPSGCELALAGILDLVLGKKARHKVLNAEAALGGLTSYARDTIIIRSLKVPALNAVSNLIILRYSLNIPFREIIRLMKECYAETELYNRLYHQNQELKYRATKAENAALKDQYEKKIAMNETRMKNLSLYPLIQGGEYSTISSQGRVFEELEIGKQTIGDMLETVVDKMPKGLKTLGANALMTKNSEIFQLLTKAVNYTDWLCKGIGYKYLTEYSKYRNVRMEPHQANAIVSTLFVDYDQFTTPGREYLNRMGILWFMMYKYRIIPATILSMMMNPARTVFGAAAAETLGTGSLLTDNWITKTLTGDIGYSIGLGMIFRGIAMHPLAVLLGCLI